MIKELLNLKRIYKFYIQIRKGIESKNKELLESPKYWEELFELLLSIIEVKEMLSWYKTYIVAALMGALTVLKSLGYIDEQTYQTLMRLLEAGGLTTVAAKINRMAAGNKPPL